MNTCQTDQKLNSEMQGKKYQDPTKLNWAEVMKFLIIPANPPHWAPKSDLRRKIQNNFCDVGVNFLVSDGIK